MNHANKVLGVVAAAILLPLGAYVSGYFLLGDAQDVYEQHHGIFTGVERTYRTEFEATIFKPAGRVESFLRGVWIGVEYAPDAQILGLPHK